MYINPFIGGVLATIGVEILVVFVAALICAIKEVRK